MSEYRTVRDLRGKAIVSANTGQKVGTVSGVMLDPAALRVAAVTTSKGSLLRPETEMIPADKIKVYGQDVILVSNGDAIVRDLGDPSERNWVDAAHYLQAKSAVSLDGQRIGQIGDILLDGQGRIVGYDLDRVEQSSPLAQSRFIPARATHSLGKDVLIVDLSRAQAEQQERIRPAQMVVPRGAQGTARTYDWPAGRTESGSEPRTSGAATIELPERNER